MSENDNSLAKIFAKTALHAALDPVQSMTVEDRHRVLQRVADKHPGIMRAKIEQLRATANVLEACLPAPAPRQGESG